MVASVVLLSQEHKTEWLTVKQAADFLGLSEWSIRRRIRDGKLLAHLTNVESGAYRIKQTDAEDYLQRMRVHPPQQ